MLICHCTVGEGLPLAAAEKVTALPDATPWLAGLLVTTGATEVVGVVTVSVAADVVAEPPVFVNTARYSLLF